MEQVLGSFVEKESFSLRSKVSVAPGGKAKSTEGEETVGKH
jgi:hypothetical protein